MKFLSNSMNSLGPSQLNPPSMWFTSGASSTLQMHPLEGSSHQNPFSFHWYGSQQNSTISLFTHKHPSHQLNCEIREESVTPGQHKDGTMMLTRSLTTTLMCQGRNKDLWSQRSKYKSYEALRGCDLGARDCLQVWCRVKTVGLRGSVM